MQNTKVFFGLDWQLIKLGWLPLALSLGALLCYLVVGRGLVNKIGEYNGDTKEMKTKLLAIKGKVDYLESIDQGKIEKLSEMLEVAVFSENKAYFLLETVRRVVAGFGYQVDSFDLSPGNLLKGGKEVVAREAQPMSIRVGLIGPTANYESLLGGIEGSLPIMSIEGLKLKSEGVSSYVEMTVNAFFVPMGTLAKIDSIPLAELKLGPTEESLLALLKDFQMVSGVAGSQEGGTFVKYERTDPFTLPE